CAKLLNQLAVVLDDVAAAHPGENLVIARLNRQVHVFTHLWQLGYSSDEILTEVPGIARQKPDALQPVDPVEPRQQLTQQHSRPQITSIALDDLAEEYYFARAAIDQ